MKKFELVILGILIMAFCFVSGYADGRWLGEAIGYQKGYGRAMAIVDDYPQATFEGYTVNIDGGGTFSFGELTVVGEQNIIDFVSNVPEIKKANGGVEVNVGEASLFSKYGGEASYIDGTSDYELGKANYEWIWNTD